MGVQQVGFLTAERAPGAILCNTVGGHAMALVVIMIAQLDHIVTITLFLTAAANLGRAEHICIYTYENWVVTQIE